MNLTDKDELELIQIPNYSVEIDSLLELRGRTRAVIYIKEQLKYTRRYDLETKGEPTVWITIYPKSARPINFQNHYRQWQEMGPTNYIPNTKDINKQTQLYKKVIQKWMIANNERETISVSNTNIDLNKDYINLPNMGPFNRSLYPLYKLLKEGIIDNGSIPIKTRSTKTNINKPDTWIDHLFTNKPLLITNHRIIQTGLSDHKILIFYRKSKRPIEHPKFYLSRKYSEIDWTSLEQQLNNDQLLQSAATDDNPNRVAENIINSINKHLDAQQRIKKYK